MVGVATVALIERKPTISRDLFTRYWRDVHGVMAARIPGFESYTQYHVTPISSVAETFEGVAVVTFAKEKDREGLIQSAVTPHIHRDEQNVFCRALLYNLAPGAVSGCISPKAASSAWFLAIATSCPDIPALASRLHDCGFAKTTHFDLTSGDPGGWNDTDVEGKSGRLFSSLIQGFGDIDEVARAIGKEADHCVLLRVDDEFAMVANGRPTPLGFRGMPALETILEANAVNQLDSIVEDALYRPQS